MSTLTIDTLYRKLLKALIKELEASNTEISETVLQSYTKRLADSPPSKHFSATHAIYSYSPTTAKLSVITSKINQLESRLIQQNQQKEDHGGTEYNIEYGTLLLHASENMLESGTGSFAWEAGFFLAEFILNNQSFVSNKRCLEIGCGVGMLSIVAHRIGASVVISTDGDPDAVRNCTRNFRLNGIDTVSIDALDQTLKKPPMCLAQQLCWSDATTLEGILDAVQMMHRARKHPVDVVLGADVLYDPESIPHLLSTIKQAVFSASTTTCCHTDDAGCVMLLATTKRNEETLNAFIDAVHQDRGLMLEDITDSARMMENGIQFHHIQSLENARERIILHKLTLNHGLRQS